MNQKNTNANPYQTLLVICVGLIILFLCFKWQWPIWGALLIGLLGIISPFLAKKIDYLWMQLAYVLSLFVPNILLSLVYFLLLVPIAFLSRIINRKDTLLLKNKQSSTFKSFEKRFEPSSFENPW